MKRWKRCLLVLAVLAFTVMGAQAVMATETGTTADGFKWVYEDGTMAITGYEGTATAVNIPAKINGNLSDRSTRMRILRQVRKR